MNRDSSIKPRIISAALLGSIILITQICQISKAAPRRKSYNQLCLDAARQNNTGKFKAALESATKATKLKSKIAEAYYQKGIALTNLSSPKQALYNFSHAIKLQPGHHNSFVQRGHLLFRLGNISQGLDDIERAVSLNPVDIKTINDAQRVIRAKKLTWYRKRFQNIRDPKNNYLSKGVNLESKNKNKEAVKVYSSGIKPGTTNSCAFEYRGNAYKSLGDFKLAVGDFTKAINLSPTERRFYLGRAACYEHMNSSALALKDLDTATYIDPRSILSPRAKAIYLQKLKRYEKAIQTYSHILKYHPALADIYVRRGDCYSKTKQYKLALKDYLRGLNLDMSESKSIYTRIANVYEKLGNHEKAKKYRSL